MNLKKEEEITLFFLAKFKNNMHLRESVHFSVSTMQNTDFIRFVPSTVFYFSTLGIQL